jgi:hypothetical protein
VPIIHQTRLCSVKEKESQFSKEDDQQHVIWCLDWSIVIEMNLKSRVLFFFFSNRKETRDTGRRS